MRQVHEEEPDSPREDLPNPPPNLVTAKNFLRSKSGLSAGQAACANKRYIPKGGFIKVFDEITDSTPARRTHKRLSGAPLKLPNSRYYVCYEDKVFSADQGERQSCHTGSGFEALHPFRSKISVLENKVLILAQIAS